jgi:hypothetical protein
MYIEKTIPNRRGISANIHTIFQKFSIHPVSLKPLSWDSIVQGVGSLAKLKEIHSGLRTQAINYMKQISS